MGLPYRQRRCLHRMERALSRSDPHLAGMLSVFTRINAGERIGDREQLRATGWWVGCKAARLVCGFLALLAGMARVTARAACGLPTACRWAQHSVLRRLPDRPRARVQPGERWPGQADHRGVPGAGSPGRPGDH